MKSSILPSLSNQTVGTAVRVGTSMTIPRIREVGSRDVMKPDFLADFLNNQKIAGAVTLVAREGKVVHFAATGYADLKTRRAMNSDDLFWIASMTKPITAAAIMLLVDEGELALDDSVGKWLPEFENTSLIEEKTDDQIVSKQSRRPVTLRDLLRHTHGLKEELQPAPEASLAEWVHACAHNPLEFEPESRWQYGNMGMNVLGRVVETVVKEPFPVFLRRRFFEPLGMQETTFFPTPAQAKRMAKLYAISQTDGPLEEAGIQLLPGEITSSRRTVFPGGGLFSTAREMLLFFQMLADGGVSGGHRYLSESSVKAMTTTQTGDLIAGFGEGMTYGLGFNVLREPTGYTQMLSAGSYGHDGVAGTSVWIEPRRKLVMVLMMQGDRLHQQDMHYRVRAAFHAAACEAFPVLK